MRALTLSVLAAALGIPGPTAGAQQPVRVVTSLSTYAAIAREIVGDRGEVFSIGQGNENPHFVQPRPSYALQVQRADLFVYTGLDLEVWVPALLDRAGNARVRSGGSGHVMAATGVDLLGVPTAVSRSEGDVHAFGNPHIWADPVNAVQIGQNIVDGLTRVAPAHAAYFQQRFEAWRDRVARALVGDTLVTLLGGPTVLDLARQGTLWSFLGAQSFEGRPLREHLGGWLRTGLVFRDRAMVCYHKEWDYFSARFAIPCVDFVEPKPGIPPTPGHVAQLIARIRADRIPVVYSASYYDQNQVRTIAERTGARAVIVSANAGGAPGTDSYVDLVSSWVNAIAEGFRAAGAR